MEMILHERPTSSCCKHQHHHPAVAHRPSCRCPPSCLTAMAKKAGVPTMLHSCGLERDLVAWCAEETDLDCINPLEVPPMGDCDLAELKRRYGDRIALMGNLHTTEVMLHGSPEDVMRASREAIEAAGAGGGFILSTGDQCGRDTPDENIRAMVRAAEVRAVLRGSPRRHGDTETTENLS